MKGPKAAVRRGWRLQRQGDVAGAKAAYQRAIDSMDADVAPDAAFLLGQLLEGQGDVAGAKAAYQRAFDSRDADVASWAAFLLRQLLEGQGDVAGAKAVYQQAIDSAHADISDSATEDIVIRVVWTDSVKPTRDAEIIKLAILLREDGHPVTLEEDKPTGGSFGLGSVETVAIFIGSSAGAGLVAAIVTDVYNRAKKWAREQWNKKKKTIPRPVRFLS